MTAPKIVAYDIETAPSLAHVWGIWQQNVGLNQLLERGEVMSFAYRDITAPKSAIRFHSLHHDGKDGMLAAAWNMMDEADALVTWNGKSFDRKHLNREFLLAGMTPPSPSKDIDLMLATKKRFRFISNKLENVAVELGLGGKIKHSGFTLWTRCLAGEDKAWDEMARYNKQDVHLLVDIYYAMLPWIDGLNLNLFEGLGCPRCGSAELQSRGTRKTTVGEYQRYQCQSCGAWSSSGKSLNRVDIRETS